MANNHYGPECHKHGIRSYGDVDGGVMFVGIAPGSNEMQEGKPFVGESGQLLKGTLRVTPWGDERMYSTNLICWQKDEPSLQEIAACAPRLRHEIESITPRLIVALGKLAVEAMTGQEYGRQSSAISWQKGVYGTSHSCYVLSTVHPAFVLRVSVAAMTLLKDLNKIPWIMEWEDECPRAKFEWELAQETGAAQAFIDNLRHWPYVALDVETLRGKDEEGMFDVFLDDLLMVGVSNGERTMVIPADIAKRLSWTGGELDDIKWAFHNGPFDYQAMRRFCNAKLYIHNDTLLMDYCLDERSGVHRLKYLLRGHFGFGHYETGISFKDRQWLFDNFMKVAQYNATDAYGTAILGPHLRDLMMLDNVTRVYDQLLIPAINVMAESGYRGMRVDQDVYNRLMMKWGPRFIKAEDDLKVHAEALGAPAPFNVRSSPQLHSLVFDRLGLDPPRKKYSKKTGDMSLDKDVVESLAGAHPFIDEMQAFRKLDHTMGNYMLPIRGLIKLDGGVHTYGGLHWTTTGRTAYRQPPMQDIPNPKYDRNAEFGEFRACFRPWNPRSHCIVEADFSRAEMYMAVAIHGDPNMKADLESGDPHANMAAFAFKKLLCDVTKEDRTDAKHVTFGKLFGRKERALHQAELRHFSYAEVCAFSTRWDMRYAVHVAWAESMKRLAKTEGELVSMMGRKRRFPYIAPEDYEVFNQSINFPVQSGASDAALTAMVTLAPLLLDWNSYVLLMIHDNLTFEVDRRYLREVCYLIRDTMEKPQYLGAPAIPIELSIGNSWYDTKEIHGQLEDYDFDQWAPRKYVLA